MWKSSAGQSSCIKNEQGTLLCPVQVRSHPGEDAEIGAGSFCNGLRGSVVDGGEIDEIAANAEGTGSSTQETPGGFERNAASGDKPEVWEWSKERFKVAGAAHG